MNEQDSERMIQVLAHSDFQPVDRPDDADLIILNTCSVREKPQHKVYSELGLYRKLHRNNGRKVIYAVGGCVGQQEGEILLKQIPYLDLVFGTHSIPELPQLIASVERDNKRLVNNTFQAQEHFVFPEDTLQFKKNSVVSSIAIANGCNEFCAFCIVPLVRGREVFRSSAEIIDEVRKLAGIGIKEILLLGQTVNGYGRGKRSELNFTELLGKIAAIEGIARIRFESPHPKYYNDDLIALLKNDPKLGKYQHIPLQSGSDHVLSKMGRSYTKDRYLDIIEKLSNKNASIAFSTDIIVGFPGERHEDFTETLTLMERIGFDKSYSFKYSPRPGTRAASLPDQVDEKLKSERLEQVQQLQDLLTARNYEKNVGMNEVVLVEGRSRDGKLLTGRTLRNRIVNFAGPDRCIGTLIDVRIDEACKHSLLGEKIP